MTTTDEVVLRLLASWEAEIVRRIGEAAKRPYEAYETAKGDAVRELTQMIREDYPQLVRQVGGLAADGMAAQWFAVEQKTPGVDMVYRLAADLVSTLEGHQATIIRAASDAYQTAGVRAAAMVATGGLPSRAIQQVLDELHQRGVGAFTDKSGRRWSLQSYGEMAVRTGIKQARTEADLASFTEAGLELVIVSDHGGECEMCRPWEGQVLTLGNTDPGDHAVGTVAEARRAGLLHPNCRHKIHAYTPGLTEVPTKTADPKGQMQRDRQRAIERNVRGWKARQYAAVDPAAKAKAKAKVGWWEDEAVTHSRITGEVRRTDREKILRPKNLSAPLPELTPAALRARVEAGMT